MGDHSRPQAIAASRQRRLSAHPPSSALVRSQILPLTWGGPQVVYNGGAAQARVRYYDGRRRRPGLPADVAALVSSIDPEATVITLVNLAGSRARTVLVQAGAFAEDDIVSATFTAAPATSNWTGTDTEYIQHDVECSTGTIAIDGPWLEVEPPASMQITLTLRLAAHVRTPAFRTPWFGPTA